MRSDKINPYDLSSVARNLHRNVIKKITSLRGNNLNPYDAGMKQTKPMKTFDTTEEKAAEYRIKKEIKRTIQSTLVIDNKISIDLAVDKIMNVINEYRQWYETQN